MNSVNRLVSAAVELSRDTIKKNIKTQYKGNDKQTQDTTGTHELVLKHQGAVGIVLLRARSAILGWRQLIQATWA